ncbi:MAG: hypothetical protein CL840_19495 [Crocinitomicaceae bacterium]|nr:hypothetical protein [Crocinitomicaceae bacterium]
MASGIFALLDDIGTLMDDVATMGKVAGKNTAGILGDDLAVNAEKASGFLSSRELPVLWAISKGSLLNKLIILPFAFLLSAYFPTAITVILILGGLFLAFEGVEKVYEFIVPHNHKENSTKSTDLPEEELIVIEKKKVKSAIITDFILSVEIVIITLGSVSSEPLTIQIPVVSLIALLATIGVYGVVALIVRMDDFGLKLIRLNPEDNTLSDKVGRFLIRALPWVIKSLGVIGTVALFLVSGGLFVHNLHFFHHLEEMLPIPSVLFELLAGLVVGTIVLMVVSGIKWTWRKLR